MKPNVLYVLIVDDDSSVRSFILAVLKDIQGITLLEAKDGQEALNILNKYGSNVGVIITDHDMPKMSGDELIAKAKAQLPNTRSILLSGRLQQKEVNEMKGDSKPTFFIAKPFSVGAIKTLVITLITNVMLGHDPSK